MVETHWALEVPLCQFDAAAVPTLDVLGDGPACFPVPALPEGTFCAGKSDVSQGSNTTRCLVWQLEGGAPNQLLLQEVGVSEERREGDGTRLCFAAPLLPAVSCTESAQHGTLVAVVTADGTLHTIWHTSSSGHSSSLLRQLNMPRSVNRVPLAAHFQRAGAPTALLEVGGIICVGTRQGNLVCLPATPDADATAAFQLVPMSSLGKMLGGLFGRPTTTGHAVCLLQELRFLDTGLLVAIHEDGQLHVWDLPTRRLVHTAELLPAGMMDGRWVPSLARLTGEPRDVSSSILLVCYAPKDAASPELCHVKTYEIFVEQRGEGLYKVVVEGGPALMAQETPIRRVKDLVLQNQSLHTVGAWLLYEDATGQSKVECISLAFQSGPPQSETHVQLVEEQLQEGCLSGEALQLEQEVWRTVEGRLAAAGTGAGLAPTAVAASFADTVLTPGQLSRHALHAALVRWGSSVAAEEVLQADLAGLREQLPRWVAAAGGSAAMAGSGAAVLAQWTAFLEVYAAAWQQQHRPIALLRLPDAGESLPLLVARQGGMYTALRSAVAPEMALHVALPSHWQRVAVEEVQQAKVALKAAAAVYQATGGGHLARLLWACLQEGMELESAVLPALVCAVMGGSTVLRVDWLDSGKVRSPLTAMTLPIRSMALGSLAQVSWAQLQVMLQLALLQRYVMWSQTLGLWTLDPVDAHQLETQLFPRTMELLRASAVAYWTAVTPVAESGTSGLDPVQLAASLRIHDGALATGGAATKRTRLSQGQSTYVASLLLAGKTATTEMHVVRDLPDLQRVALLFSQRLLCLSYSRMHTAARQLERSSAEQRGGPIAPDDLAVLVSEVLFAGRHNAQLAALQRLLPTARQDMRLLFFKACSCARQIRLAVCPAEQQRLEDESCSLFFRVAAVFAQAGPGQAAAVRHCVDQLLEDARREPWLHSDSPPAAQLAYYEALVMLYERLGRYSAAARFALAAARQVAAAMPGPEQLAARASVQGRLWASVFSCCMECGRYEEAYVALLSNEVAEVQLDCLHRLVAGLCAVPAGLELLCRLPFAQNLALVRGGRQVWVPMLEEVVAALQRRAAQLDLLASPQPYKVLADFHISRNNYQAAAGAMLAYARRLVAEYPNEPSQLAEAEHALATAVSSLSLVERQHAWVLDPAAVEEGVVGAESELPVLSLTALRQEYAIVRGHVALAAAMPGGERGTALLNALGVGAHRGAMRGGGDAEDVFSQLLALGLHDAAFQLAEATFVGTQLTRALERVFASLAAACVRQKLALGRSSASSADTKLSWAAGAGAGGNDNMDTDEAGTSSAAGVADSAGRGGGSGAELGDWWHLKHWLHRHEGGEHRFRLRLVILDVLLRTEPAFMLPPWLMAAFEAGVPGGDLGGALQVLMRHGRLADAAHLAVQHLQHALHSVPSVAMSRMAQVHFPQALLDELVAWLGGAGGEGLAHERQQLVDLLQRVRGSAMSQTGVIQDLFSH